MSKTTNPPTSTAYHLTHDGEHFTVIPLEAPVVMIVFRGRSRDPLFVVEDIRIHDAIAGGNWLIATNLVAAAAADLPVVVPPGTPLARITFHPEAWVRDCAVEADAEGPTTFDVGLAEVEGLEDNTDASDALAQHPNAPRWIRRWRGPFRITIERGEEWLARRASEDRRAPRSVTLTVAARSR